MRAGLGTAPAGVSGPADFSCRREKSVEQIHDGELGPLWRHRSKMTRL